jgi:L-aminoadipate-semialdehyde dehydrogenase
VSMNAIFRSPTLGGFSHEIDIVKDPEAFTNAESSAKGGSRHAGSSPEVIYSEDAAKLVSDIPTQFPATTPISGEDLSCFVTGVTGFLGAYILQNLLSRPYIKIIAHVRAKSPENGLDRISSTCKAYGIWEPEWASRITCVIGDLAKPKLGLSDAAWNEVSKTADVVIHNGALVHWVYPYLHLKPANVGSTIEALKICSEGGKGKKFGFVSSTSVLDSENYVNLSDSITRNGGTGVPESDDLSSSKLDLGNGYGQSKWVSEYLVREAGKRGLEGAIIRPGYVTGNSNTGGESSKVYSQLA